MSTVQTSRITPAQGPLLAAAAAADGHAVYAPTHLVQRDGQIVGGLSLGGLPLLFLWLDTQRVTPRETYQVWSAAAAELRGRGPVIVPCTDASPLRPYLERLGGQRVGTAHLYLKEF